MDNLWEVFLTIAVFGIWFLFPAGLFLSVSHVDKNTDQLIQLEKHRHKPEPLAPVRTKEVVKGKIQRPRPVINFNRNGIKH